MARRAATGLGMERSVCMKDIFLSNTHARAPQSFARGAIPIGERFDPSGSVIDCVHASRKWVARRGPILLARMRSLYLRKFSQAAGVFSLPSRTSRRASGPARAAIAASLAFFATAGISSGQQSTPGQPSASLGQAKVRKSSERVPQRIPRQQALTTAAVDGVLGEAVSPGEFRPVAAAQLALRHFENGQI